MAGKRKNPADNWMPPRVYRGRSAYEYRAGGKVIRLCGFTASQAQVWHIYETITKDQHDKQGTLSVLVAEFIQSQQYAKLAQSTKDKHKYMLEKILAVFGEMQAESIKPMHIRQYMDIRGVKSEVIANREKSLMSVIFAWAYERGKVQINPCAGVKNFVEKARTRYITDEEYNAVYEQAITAVRVAMELAYLCIARKSDILSMKKSQFTEQGIYIKQSKTGKPQIKAWTDRLKQAVELADALPVNNGIKPDYVIHTPDGIRYSVSGFDKQWNNAKKKCEALYPHMSFDFTFHDLKAKGLSDLEGSIHDKQHISGHKSMKEASKYDRRIPVVPVVGGQKTNTP